MLRGSLFMPSAMLSSDLRSCLFRSVLVALIGLLTAGAARAQSVSWPSVPLNGNHPAEAANLSPLAHADPAMPLNMAVTLALRNEAQLDQLLNDQQNPVSPHYHQWLTPAQFTARFGPSQQDLDAVAAWIGAQGLTVT